MRNTAKNVFFGMLLVASVTACLGQVSTSKDGSLTIVFKDGHRQSFPVAELAKIEFKAGVVVIFKDRHQQTFPVADISSFEFETSAAKTFPLGRNHFLGKWKVGDGAGSDFFITLEADGQARKTIGASHGTWTVVEGDARIAWDDGWHDVIRKVGSKHEKQAFEPGKSLSDEPSNVTDAVNTTAQPI